MMIWINTFNRKFESYGIITAFTVHNYSLRSHRFIKFIASSFEFGAD